MDLYQKTIELITNRNRTLTYPVLAEKTGLSKHWIEKFAQGEIQQPSVIKVQKLYEFLSKKELVL